MSKGERRCRICKEILTSENAYLNRTKGTFQSACRTCGRAAADKWRIANKERENTRARDYYRANKGQLREKAEAARIRRKYDLTPDQLEAMRVKQKGVCLICQTRKARCIDHCHKTGMVRGLLCHRCNTSLGLLEENLGLFERAMEYLASHRSTPFAGAS